MTASDILRTHLATRSLGASELGVITFPTVMLSRDRYLNARTACRSMLGKSAKEAPSAEVVKQILCGIGLRAERTRRDTEGVVGLFRYLLSPPPWAGVVIEDVVEDLSPERVEELTPLYRLQLPKSLLVERYREVELARSRQAQFLADPLPDMIRAVVPLTFQWRLDEFIAHFRLARLLGPERVERLADAVFGYDGDEFSPTSGVPDLFVWDVDNTPGEWFFAEVKGPGDHLQESQTTWLRNHWDDIEGRFAVIIVG